MQILQKSLACFFALFFGCLAASAQTPDLLKDINNGLASGNPRGMTTVGNTVYFSADDVVHGRELWKTTGTDASTVMVKDIAVNGSSSPANFCNVNGIVFFTIKTPTNGTQIWKTDGTANGTQFVTEIYLAGENSSFAQLTACNGKLFFRSYEEVVPPPGGALSLDLKLHVSDGTTTNVLGQTLSLPQNLTAVGNTLFLSGASPGSPKGNQLLKTDGVTVNVVKDLEFPNETEFDLPANFINVNGTLFFSAKNSAANGRQIWKSNGIGGGTVPMTNTTFGFIVHEIAHVNGTVFFTGDVATPVQFSFGPGLVRLNSLNNVTIFNTVGTAKLTAFDGRMVFTQITHLSSELSSVATTGTNVTSIKSYDVAGTPSQLTVAGTTLFFEAGNTENGRELWKSNAAGTMMVQDFMANSANANISDLCARGSEVFFASDGIGSTIGGNELRSSNGTLNGIVTVKNIGRAGSFPKEFVKMGNFTYFTADDGDTGRELWKTNGNIGNAVRVADIIEGPIGSNPTNLIVVSNGAAQTLFFVAKHPTKGRELFKLENAEAVPSCISNIVANGDSPISNLANLNGVLHFTCSNLVPGVNNIFKTNANRTAVQTVGASLALADNLIAMGSTLFFTQTPQIGGPQLWKLGGVAPIKTFATVVGGQSPMPQQLTVIGDRLFFTAADGAISRRLWVTNAAATSVSQVSSHNAQELTNFNGRLVYTAPSGNIAGQNSIFRVKPGFVGVETLATGSSISDLRAAGTNLFFFQAFQGGVVWLSKITTTNFEPAPLKEFPEGNSGISSPSIVAGNNLYFTMTVAATGNELWKSNGTIDGTVPMGDIRQGVGNSNIQSLAVCGTDLFFSANNLTNGQEPWKLANATALVGGGGDEESDGREAVLEVMAIPTSEAPEIKVYPNPATNFVNVDLPENDMTGTLSILSASGQLVRSVQSSEGESSVQLDIQDLQKGIYMVRWVKSDEQVVVKKLIVQ